MRIPTRLLLASTLLCVSSGGAATFDVVSGVAAPDSNPGNGICAAAIGDFSVCTLRAAVQEANALTGDDVITLGPRTHHLTRDGSGEDDALDGDLDITDEVEIVGVGADLTVIDAGAIQDRIFHLLQTAGTVRITDLTLRNGYAVDASGGAILSHADLVARSLTCQREGSPSSEREGRCRR